MITSIPRVNVSSLVHPRFMLPSCLNGFNFVYISASLLRGSICFPSARVRAMLSDVEPCDRGRPRGRRGRGHALRRRAAHGRPRPRGRLDFAYPRLLMLSLCTRFMQPPPGLLARARGLFEVIAVGGGCDVALNLKPFGAVAPAMPLVGSLPNTLIDGHGGVLDVALNLKPFGAAASAVPLVGCLPNTLIDGHGGGFSRAMIECCAIFEYCCVGLSCALRVPTCTSATDTTRG